MWRGVPYSRSPRGHRWWAWWFSEKLARCAQRLIDNRSPALPGSDNRQYREHGITRSEYVGRQRIVNIC